MEARGRPAVSPQLWPELLSSVAAIVPEAVALSFEGRTVTYGELDAWSNRLARVLVERGVGPESFVALGISRSIESVAAVWAVTKSGAAFVPVDPGYPPERIAYMLDDCRAVLGLTTTAHRDVWPADSVPWLLLDDPGLRRGLDDVSPAPVTDDDRRAPLRYDHPAYLIYTSGSTGRPKGVVVTHRGLTNLNAEVREHFSITHRARVSHLASPSFDASLFELTKAFCAGATLVIVPPTVYGGEELARILREEHITHAFVTPTTLASLDPTGLDEHAQLVEPGRPAHRNWSTGGRRAGTCTTATARPRPPSKPASAPTCVRTPPSPSAAPRSVSTRSSSTNDCGLSPPGSPVSSTSPAPASPAATIVAPT